MIEWVVIVSLSLLALISFYIEKSILYPPGCMALCWACLLYFHEISRPLLLPIHDQTVIFYLAGTFSFVLGGFVSHLIPRTHDQIHIKPYAPIKLLLNVSIVVELIGLPYYWQYISSLISDNGTGNAWALLRQRLIEEHSEVAGIHFMDNFVVLADIVVLIAWYERSRFKWKARIAFGLFVIYNLLTAGRAGFVTTLISLFAIEILARRRFPIKAILVLVLVFAFSFFGLAILVGKAGASKEASIKDNIPALVEGFQLYTVGAVVAFDNVYQHPSYIPATQTIMRTAKIMLAKFGIQEEVPYLHAEYSTVGKNGLDTNVYTIYFSYFLDMGTIGSLIMMFFLGGGVTWAYFQAKSGGAQAIIMFSVLFFGIPLSGYSENYFLNLNFLVKLFIITLCYRMREKSPRAGLVAI